MAIDDVDLILSREYGEMIGRVRTAKWVLFLMGYKDEKEIKETLEKMVMRDLASDSRLLKLERY